MEMLEALEDRVAAQTDGSRIEKQCTDVAVAALEQRCTDAAAATAAALERSAATIADYEAVAGAYARANADHDVSQNVEALLSALRASDGERRLAILDLGCGGGRDLAALARRNCDVWGVDGSPTMCAIAAAACPEATVRAVDFVAGLDLPLQVDGVFANASLFHAPSARLPAVLRDLRRALKPGGVLFASVRHGDGGDVEGWARGRSPTTRAWVARLSEGTWDDAFAAAGFELLRGYHRGDTTNYYCTVWRRGGAAAG